MFQDKHWLNQTGYRISHPHPLSFKNPGSTIEYRHPQRKKVFIFSRICRNDLCHLITLLGPSSITDEIEAIHFLFCQPKRMGLQRKWYNVTYSSYVFELKGYHDLLPRNSLRDSFQMLYARESIIITIFIIEQA